MFDSTFRSRVPASIQKFIRPHAPQHSARSSESSVWQARDWQAGARASRWPTAIVSFAIFTVTVWGIAATAYLIMRSDQVAEGVQQRAAMQSAYEERISRLRSEVDAINSRLMLDQDSFDAKLEALRQRQTVLERRQGELAKLLDGVRHPAFAAISGMMAAEATGILPANANNAKTLREIHRDFSAQGGPVRPAADKAAASNPADHALLRLLQSQDRVEASQQATLDGLEAGATALAATVEMTVADLGFDPKAFAFQPISSAPTVAAAAAVGGPFVPVPLSGPNAGSPFERQVGRVRARIARSIDLYEGLVALPLRAPLGDDRDISSGFGTRRDPFLGSLAMHTGIDIRADRGTPVRAAADGVVTVAGPYAGYGKMVEIEHRNGVSTRYGHLSAIDVAEGMRVKAGDTVGEVGSTGRSTGPHLHYETRVNGEPVDPGRFLKAGDRFAAALAAE
jgi:murein DD-endopeptidase MepM/ murein hydrolase activator NlpD